MCLQDIVDKGIAVPAAGLSASTEGVGQLVRKVAAFLGRFLQPTELTLVARLSVWHSFTADLVGARPAVLGDLQRLSVLWLADGRYSMHSLVSVFSNCGLFMECEIVVRLVSKHEALNPMSMLQESACLRRQR